MTLMVRIAAIMSLVLCGSLQSWHSSGTGRSAVIRSSAASPGQRLSIGQVWAPSLKFDTLSEVGRGKGIVFSPDLSEPGNREFYRALGFAYFEDPDWHSVLGQIKQYNEAHPESRIETLLIQSHGTNGDALKLQNGKQAEAPRSYIAPAALQERLEGSGVRTCLLAACNAGRLFRPENYRNVQAGEGNHLFEPPTLGIINASPDFDPDASTVMLARRVESHIEVINECLVSELGAVAKAELARSDSDLKASARIAIPEMLIELLLQDQQLHLVSSGYEVERSRAETGENDRERLIVRFLRFVNRTAAKENR